MTDLTVKLPNPPSNVIELRLVSKGRLERTMHTSQHCAHHRVTVDTSLSEVKCDDCNERLNPIQWIADTIDYWGVYIKREGARYWRERHAYEAVRTEVEKRSKVKCHHCKQFTKVHVHLSSAQLRAVQSGDGPPDDES